MSLYASVNACTLPRLVITSRDDNDNDNDNNEGEDVIEDIVDPRYAEGIQLAYPPHPKFRFSYDCYLKHASCVWTVNENDPSEDFDKFAKAPADFQRIILCTAGCIMIGDSVVLDKLEMPDITPVSVRIMLTNQADRENTHQIVYSRWCDVAPNSDYYRSIEFRREYMGEFETLAYKYATHDVRIIFYFIMLCENIMFAPFFQIINYLAVKGYAPKICNSNLLVMRDEYMHYVHARGISASFRRRISHTLARQMLADMDAITLRVIRKIIGDYNDGYFNYAHVEAHFRHIVHGFMIENSLYWNEQEELENEKLWGTTPAESYMSAAKAEIKINLMETSSTIYEVDGIDTTINMDF
nr:rr2 [Apis mellifera nudivirus]